MRRVSSILDNFQAAKGALDLTVHTRDLRNSASSPSLLPFVSCRLVKNLLDSDAPVYGILPYQLYGPGCCAVRPERMCYRVEHHMITNNTQAETRRINYMFKKLSLVLTGALACASFSVQAEDWRAWNIHNDGHPNTAAMDRFSELVSEATGGEINVEVFHGGVLGSQPDALEQVRLGAIEIGNFNLGPIGPIVKEANLVSLPFIFKSVPHMFRVLEGEAGETIAAAMAEAGIKPLAWVDAGARSFYSQKPINTPADVEGLKIRVMNNDLYTSMISAMGGNPSPMAFAEVQQALKTGVVDGAENNFPSFKSVGHYEVTTHYSLSEHLIIPECICVNTAKFDALSEDMQAAVRGAAEEAALYQRELWAVQSGQAREEVEAAGIVVNEIADKGPFQDAMVAVYDEYLAANPDMADLVEMAKNTE